MSLSREESEKQISVMKIFVLQHLRFFIQAVTDPKQDRGADNRPKRLIPIIHGRIGGRFRTITAL